MAEQEYTVPQVRQAIAKALQDQIAAHTEGLKQLRKREVARASLVKGELCLLCGQCGTACTCLTKAEKKPVKKMDNNAAIGMGPGSAMDMAEKTEVGEVNREMKGYKSIASNPTAMPASKPKLVKPGEVRSTAGTIHNAKSEISAAPGAKLPKRGKKIEAPGSGGGEIKEIKKHVGSFARSPEPGTAPLPGMTKPVGVSGKQPIGQGGGDAHKLPSAPAPHADTAASLADVKSLSPASQSKGNIAQLKQKLASIAANKKAAPAPAPAQAAVPARNEAADLAADKKAAGIGFLNSLRARFRPAAKVAPAAAAPAGSGPVRQQSSPYRGARGMAALARGEMDAAKTKPAAAPAAPAAAAPAPSKRFHGVRPLQRAEVTPMKKSAFSLGLGRCAMCKGNEHAGLCKAEVPSPVEGLSAINHSRKMLRVGSKKARKRAR